MSNRNRATTWKATLPCKFHQLPRNTVMDILSRLPMKAQINCRCVCRRWLHLISDPNFSRLCSVSSPIGILIKTLPSKNESKRLQLAQAESDGSKFQVEKVNLTLKNNIPTCKITRMNSCNGLLFLDGGGKEDPVYVCNPILGEYLTIQPVYKDRHRGSFAGLGYSSGSDEYKVIQTFHPPVDLGLQQDHLEAKIYTVGTGVWRNIGYAPHDLVSLPFNTFLNGALHWVPCVPNSKEFIWCFDFVSEQFRPLPPPPHFREEDKKYTDFMRMGVLGGCLYISVFEDSSKFDIWVMTEYGVQESWSKKFAIENLYPRARGWDFYEPISLLRNGEILMLYNGDTIVCYNPKRKNLRETKFFRTRSGFTAIAYTPCFTSLFDLAKGEQWKVSRIRETGEHLNSSGEQIVDSSGFGGPVAHSSAAAPVYLTPNASNPGQSPSAFRQVNPQATNTSNFSQSYERNPDMRCATNFSNFIEDNCLFNNIAEKKGGESSSVTMRFI